MTKKDEFKIEISISSFKISAKPKADDMPKISNSFTSYMKTIDEIIDCCSGENNSIICPGVFDNNKRLAANWISQQSIFIDFDEGIGIDEAIKRLEDNGIKLNFYYHTFSHTTENPRFRFVIILDKMLTDQIETRNILKGLSILFPESDKSCNDLARMFFGGNNAVKVSDIPMSVETINNICMKLNIKESEGEVDNTFKIKYNTKLKNNGDRDEFFKRVTNYGKEDKWDRLYELSPTYRDFYDGLWLYHNELFSIISNLIIFKGGEQKIKEIMSIHHQKNKKQYGIEKIKIIKTIKYYKYLPVTLSSFSKYKEEHIFSNFYDLLKNGKNEIEVLDNKIDNKLDSLDVIYNKMKDLVDGIMERKEKKIYIIKVPCGVGKTELLSTLENVQIAVPTHNLKEELCNRMQVEYTFTEKLPEFTSKYINKKIEKNYNLGLYFKVNNLINDISNNKDNKYEIKDINAANIYLKSKEKEENNKTILTTHRFGVFNSLKEISIFDEDPHSVVFAINEIIKLQVIETINKMTVTDELMSLREHLVKSNYKGVIENIKIDYNIGDAQKNLATHYNGNFFDFMSSESYLFDPKNDLIIRYIKHNILNPEKTHIILSASPQTEVYMQVYGNDMVEFHDFSNVENKGKIIQYCDYSFSRESLNSENVINFIKERTGDIPIITFLNSKDHFDTKNESKYHFGNLEGTDTFKGMDIGVAGTPHINVCGYYLYASLFGVKAKEIEKLKERKVQFNNCRFSFMTFKDPEMQKIQLTIIYNQLIQAIGRSRIVRYDCTVKVFSNLPIPNATIIDRGKENNNDVDFEETA